MQVLACSIRKGTDKMIRVVMFDSINGENPLYNVERRVETEITHNAMACEYKTYRFMLQTIYHLGHSNETVLITVYDANNEVFQDRKLTLREWMDENED
jgi:hypothetical protein